MKSLIIGAVCLVVGAMAGVTIGKHWPGASSATPVAESTPAARDEMPAVAAPKPELPKIAHENTNAARPVPIVAASANEPKDTNATAMSRAIETLVSSKTSFQEKQAVWKQLREAGQLDEAIDALKQSARENPTAPEYPIAMGQGELQKAYQLSKTGGTVSQMGIAGMQADQDFDTALQLDPANWEAQFYKAAAMSHWPAEMNKGPEVIQRFSTLIDQQETMPSQPQFAQTYAALGDQYMKAGQTDYAMQTWQLGAQKYPTDSTLQQKIAGARK